MSCGIPGCGAEVTKHGSRSRRLCSVHNQRWLRGDRGERLSRPVRPYAPHVEKECRFDGCSKPVRARGLCAGHYNQRRKGKVLTPLDDRRLGRRERYHSHRAQEQPMHTQGAMSRVCHQERNVQTW